MYSGFCQAAKKSGCNNEVTAYYRGGRKAGFHCTYAAVSLNSRSSRNKPLAAQAVPAGKPTIEPSYRFRYEKPGEQISPLPDESLKEKDSIKFCRIIFISGTN